jgi:hypothetical protein
VFVQHHSFSDVETGGKFMVKKFESDGHALPDGTWRHTEIRLVPVNPEFPVKTLPQTEEDEVKVIAEWLEVLK